MWLAPVQMVIATVSEKSEAYGRSVYEKFAQAGLRAELDVGAEKIGAKIRRASLQKPPYVVVIGERESSEQTVNVRTRGKGTQEAMGLETFIERCRQQIASRTLEL